MKNKRFIFFTILMIFATTFSANTESFTYISGTDSIKDFPPIFNSDIQILANRRYESTSSPTINNDGVDTAGEGRTFDIGNLWLNTTSGQYYICIDNSTGASVWKIITLSASDIKTLYESNSDTNAFTDALLSKLNNVSQNANWVEDSIINGNILIDSVETTVYDDSNVVKLTGDQSIDGVKTFTSTISGSISGNAGTVTSGVYTTGNQSISGIKTFNDSISVDTINEKTSANGVTIDGVTLKDGGGTFTKDSKVLKAGGTSDYHYKVHSTNGSYTYMQFANSDTGLTLNDGFLVGIDNSENAILYNLENTSMQFWTNNALQMEINSDGVVSMPNQANISMVAINSLSLTANTTDINFTSDEIDPQAEFNGTTYTPDTSGKVYISIQAQGSTGKINCYENGTLYRNIIIADGALSGSRLIPVTSGNSYTFRSSTTVTITNRSISILKEN